MCINGLFKIRKTPGCTIVFFVYSTYVSKIKDIMDTQRTEKVQKEEGVLLADNNYFKYVFKKTEKIVCVVFYILHNTKDIKKDIKEAKGRIALDIEQAARQTLSGATATLALKPHDAKTELLDLLALLISLQSHVELGRSVGILGNDAAEVLTGELEGVMRSIATYMQGSGKNVPDFEEESSLSAPKLSYARNTDRIRTPQRKERRGDQGSRQETIRAIISTKGVVSIKDISDNIKDCSEKTIQRELNSMIENGLIKREGKRRWSQYSLI